MDNCLGKHIIIDFWEAENLKNLALIEEALTKTADLCNAKVLSIKTHEFGEDCGITGVAILAESHISVHTWPEFSYAAFDIFVCSKCDFQNAVNYLKQIFKPEKSKIREIKRGEICD